ncbi:MAG: methyltransferase [Myxococcota bacterium]|nr:methyltransferase [Myxococcota bacterium]
MPQHIERHVADAFWGGIDLDELPEQLLVVGDLDGIIEARVTARGQRPSPWCRWTVGRRIGHVWPQGIHYDGATLRIPKEKAALTLYLDGIASTLKSGAPVWIYGANDEGIRSVTAQLDPLFSEAQTVATRRHCRIVQCHRTAVPARGRLAAWLTRHPLTIYDETFRWHSYPGVFAAHSLDPASELLMAHLPSDLGHGNVLDFCCGTGPLAMAIKKRNPLCRLQLLDADLIALAAAQLNLPGTRVHASDGWSHLPNDQFDLIVSNPPIHRGKIEDRRILRSLISEAPSWLSSEGRLMIVVQRRLHVVQALQATFKHVKKCADDGRFQVWEAR